MTDSIRTLARSLARELATDEIDLVGGAYGSFPGQDDTQTRAVSTRCAMTHIDSGGLLHSAYYDDDFRGNM